MRFDLNKEQLRAVERREDLRPMTVLQFRLSRHCIRSSQFCTKLFIFQQTISKRMGIIESKCRIRR